MACQPSSIKVQTISLINTADLQMF